MNKFLSFLTLFTSFGTLLCCALPALLVSLGLGSALVSLLGAVPGLILVSEHKGLVFGVAGGMLLLSFVWRRLAPQSCPADPALASACSTARRNSTVLLYLSVAIYAVGGFFAFVAPALF